jgi:tetratricopeptide (TPR) repeat protein
MEIHIQLAGIQLGPYNEKQIRDYVAEGLLSMTDKAREEGSLTWIEVSEMLAKLPPPPAPAPPPDPDAVFLEEPPPPPEPEPKRAPNAAPNVSHLPSRVVDSKKISLPALVDALAAKSKTFGPSAPSAPGRGITASKSINTTAPLVGNTKKMSRTALAKALQNRTEPLPSRAGNASIPLPPKTETRRLPAGAPETTGPMAPGGPEAASEPPPQEKPAPEDKKSSLPSLMRALTAKTVPMRVGPPPGPAPAAPPPSAPPVPGTGSAMPITSPLPTRAIMNPAAGRAPHPAAPPPPEMDKVTEKLPTSRKAAELRARMAEKAAAREPEPEPAKEPEQDSEPTDEPAPPRRRVFLPLLTALTGVLAVAGIYYVWSPYHVAGTLLDAMSTGNALDLERTVDFPAVADSLKQQVGTLAANSGAPNAAATSDATTMIDKSIDLYVNATGISNLVTRSGQFKQEDVDQAISPDVASGIVGAFVSQPPRSKGLASLTDFAIQNDLGVMHLKFHGLAWKLERIDVRPDLPASTTGAPTPTLLTPVVQTYITRGEAALDQGESKSAIDDFSQAIAIDPHSSIAYDDRGKARHANGDDDAAIKDFTQALTLDPQMATAYEGRGNARASKGDLDGAITDFTQALKIDPTLATAYDSRGNAQTARDQLDAAIADYTQAISIDPNLASAYSDRGFARQANGNLDGAISDYGQAIKLKPKTPMAYYNRGLALQSEGNLQGAIVDFGRALAFDSQNANAYYSRANAKYAIHDTDGAIADYTEAIALNPKLPLAYSDRGQARQAKGDLDGALADYTQALALDPKIAIAYFRRGLIEACKGNLDGAIADSTQSLDLDPKNAQAYYNRGFAKLVRGNLDGATSDLKSFCDAAPRDRFADNARLYLWLISKMQASKLDADQELSDALENNWNTSTDDFTAKTAAFLLGRVTESDYLASANSSDADTDAAQHCQAWYFAGMKRLLMGDKGTAADYFQKCLATGKKDFCEYILAKAQLQAPSAAPAPAPVPAPSALPPIAPSVPTTPPVALPLNPPAP